MQKTSNLQNHEFYMTTAFAQAKKAFAKDEVPIGAVIVNSQGIIIARAHNMVETTHAQTAHAELRALTKAGKEIGDWRLEGCWLYVTLEPCAMCMNAIKISRLAGIVFAAKSPLFGYSNIDNRESSWLYKNDTLAIIGGIYSEKSVELLQEFFKKKRMRSRE